ncbi:hypothetical protein M1432_02665 [Patescibacteria group bacterium]|nr:hypothetical protein [Patescibacteria group bacterium]
MRTNKSIIWAAILIGGVSAVHFAWAQTPAGQAATSVIITWQAQNYFPADFPGKASVTPGSPVKASVEELSGNRLVNLGQAQVSWFVNDNLIQSGVGLKSIIFTASPDPTGLVNIRVQVQTGSGSNTSSISITASPPFAVIDYPAVQKNIPSGGKIVFTAWPYFFNVSSLSDLKFTWQLNGQTVTSSGNQLTLDIGTPQSSSQQMLPVTLTTQNIQNPLEFSRTVNVFNIIGK